MSLDDAVLILPMTFVAFAKEIAVGHLDLLMPLPASLAARRAKLLGQKADLPGLKAALTVAMHGHCLAICQSLVMLVMGPDTAAAVALLLAS